MQLPKRTFDIVESIQSFGSPPRPSKKPRKNPTKIPSRKPDFVIPTGYKVPESIWKRDGSKHDLISVPLRVIIEQDNVWVAEQDIAANCYICESNFKR